jgi:hypothetical protein
VRAVTAKKPEFYSFYSYLIAPGILFGLLIVFLISPQFYLDHILDPCGREFQWVEILTFVSSLTAGILLSMVWIKRYQTPRIEAKLWGTILIGFVGLASLFFAGEECSWGQTYFNSERQDYSGGNQERNLHNSGFPIQSLGSLFIFCVFIVLPVLSRIHRTQGIIIPFGITIPSSPILFCMCFAFLWKQCKTLYRFWVPNSEAMLSPFYRSFMEQMNEHKEMMIAVGLLMYAWEQFNLSKTKDRPIIGHL